MNPDCPDIEDLAAAKRMAKDDPRRKHVESCPRCRARAALYRRFLDPGAPPAGANLDDARRRMTAVLEREMNGGAQVGDRIRPRTSFIDTVRPLFRPAWRPALGLLGTAAAVMLIVRLTGAPGPGDGSMVLRSNRAASTTAPTLLQPIRDANHTLVLRWTSAAGADAYQVILYGTDLLEKVRYAAGADTTLRVDPERLESLPPSVLWAVAALRAGDEVGRTDPQALNLR